MFTAHVHSVVSESSVRCTTLNFHSFPLINKQNACFENVTFYDLKKMKVKSKESRFKWIQRISWARNGFSETENEERRFISMRKTIDSCWHFHQHIQRTAKNTRRSHDISANMKTLGKSKRIIFHEIQKYRLIAEHRIPNHKFDYRREIESEAFKPVAYA